jgi:signal transduction histidine kinase
MQHTNEPNSGRLQARLQRLLNACRKGLNHDLTNQLVALQGLLQLLNLEEAAGLNPTGQDYVRRMLGVAQRTQALARTLADLSRLGSDVAPADVLLLPELAEEARATLQPPPICTCQWQSLKVQAPRALVLQALIVAFRLLAEPAGGSVASFAISTFPCATGVELTAAANPDPTQAPTLPPPLADFPKAWHDRLECVLLEELAECWDGQVQWQMKDGAKMVALTLPVPR